MTRSQSASSVLMVRPAAFGPNPETATSNAFQASAHSQPDEVHAMALAEFDLLSSAISDAGVRVLIVEDSQFPPKPDAIFPNNWLSFHEQDMACIYPLASPLRRPERRIEILEALGDQFKLGHAVDYSHEEEVGRYLEGTGSMVLDRISRTAYVCQSPRSNPEVLEAFCKDFGYENFFFDAIDQRGIPIYHTNVMMSIGTDWALVCADSISNDFARGELLERLSAGRSLITISLDQMDRFAGNILELHSNHEDSRIIVMSETAEEAFEDDQYDALLEHAAIISSPLDTVERYGGGSARCMICEVFLEPKPSG